MSFCLAKPAGGPPELRHGGDPSLLLLAIESMAQGLFMLDADQRIIVLNQRFLDIYGLPSAVIKVGATAYDIVEQSVLAGNYPGLSLEEAWARASARLASKLPWRVEQRLGTGKAIAIAFAPMQAGGWVTTHLDVTDKRNAEDRLEYLANHDVLTGLANRMLVNQTLVSQIEARSDFAVFCMDLDRFKAVNDNLGHAAGDELLRQVANRLVAVCPPGALVARLGGDEFLVQLVSERPKEAAPELATAVMAALNQPFSLDGQVVQIGVSVGISVAPADGDTPETLIAKADIALYQAKHEGRGAFSVYAPGLGRDRLSPAEMASDLRRALADDALGLVYQPIRGLADDELAGFEALLRWQHPTRGPIPPEVILSIADRASLTVQIGQWVLRQACRQAASWRSDIGVSVNLSSWQIRSANLVAAVAEVLAQSGLAPSRLTLEISETLMTVEDAEHRAALEALRHLGVRICLDDFGAATGSLGQWLTVPFDKVKVDRRLVAESTYRDDYRAVIEAVADLAGKLGIEAGANGVETPEQLALLRRAGFRQVQGFLIGLPMQSEDVVALVSDLG